MAHLLAPDAQISWFYNVTLACRFLIDRQIKDIADLSSAVRLHA